METLGEEADSLLRTQNPGQNRVKGSLFCTQAVNQSTLACGFLMHIFSSNCPGHI